jgi:putative mRNA 3-end processing factor
MHIPVGYSINYLKPAFKINKGDQMHIDLPEARISLDGSSGNADFVFISHAHSDHIKGARGKNIITSEETAKIIEAREKIGLKRSSEGKFEMLDAGHILGSKQLFIDSSIGYSILYTGDYQLQKSCVAPAIEPRQADILIIDSTYPYLNVKFDERSEVEEAIRKYITLKLEKGIVLFSAYSLGKAQELVKIINSIGIVPVVDKKISQVNKIYNEYGMGLRYASFYDNEDEFNEIVKRNFVGIVSTRSIRELARSVGIAYGKKVFTAIATGFAKMFRFETDVQFGLSDHADIYQALEYISIVNPKIIYTSGSNSHLMAENLKKFGYNATPFAGLSMLELAYNNARLMSL